MNRIKNTLFIGLIFCNLTVFAQKKQIDIAALIGKMSIEEKAGEMTQLDLGVIANGDVCNLTQPQSINPAKLKKAINQYHIGSFLNVGCGSGTISRENWQKIFTAYFPFQWIIVFSRLWGRGGNHNCEQILLKIFFDA